MPKPHVLVVDDDLFVQEVAACLLDKQGCQVSLAGDGHTAHALIQNETPDLVVCDIIMEDTNGVSLFSAVRREGFRMPFIFLTSISDADMAEAALRAGAAAYCTKPFESDRLVALVKSVLATGNDTLPPRPRKGSN